MSGRSVCYSSSDLYPQCAVFLVNRDSPAEATFLQGSAALHRFGGAPLEVYGGLGFRYGQTLNPKPYSLW